MKIFSLNSKCDICGHKKQGGNHVECSKARQEQNKNKKIISKKAKNQGYLKNAFKGWI